MYGSVADVYTSAMPMVFSSALTFVTFNLVVVVAHFKMLGTWYGPVGARFL